MKSLDAFLYGPKDIRLKTVETPPLRPTQILVKLSVCGICGSDVHCYLGESAEGRYDLGPYTPGHEWCGDVVAVGSDVISLKVGDRVTGECANSCNRCENCKEGLNHSYCTNWNEVGFMPSAPGGMGEYLVGEEQFCHRIPDSMTDFEGALVEPCSVAYHAIYAENGRVTRTDDCLIIGGGPIGLFAAVICKAAGARVILADPYALRRQIAREVIGVDATVNPRGGDILQAVTEMTNGRGASLIVECTGSDSGVAMTVDAAAPHARIRFVGHSIGRKIPIEIGKAIWKGLNLRGSCGATWAFPDTIRFLARVKQDIDYSQFVTGVYPLARVQDAFEWAIGHKDSTIKIMVTMYENNESTGGK